MSGTIGTLRYMADQIARNFIALGHDKAVLATADHIDMFWDPRMKQKLFEDAEGPGRDQLGPVAAAAIDYLAKGNKPEPQTRATQFNSAGELHNSDAG